MTKPSWQDFGTHDESIVPELWDGVVGAWAPCLGPTGSRLHDMSRRSNWGTLTNMDNATDWVVSDGQYALDFDGSNDSVGMGTAINSLTLREMSVACWVSFRTFSKQFGMMMAGNITAGTSASFVLEFGRTANRISWLQSGFDPAATVGAGSISDSLWHSCVGVRSGATGAWTITLAVDNVISSHNVSTNPSALSSLGQLRLGWTDYGANLNGKMDDIKIWNRSLSIQEIRQLHQLGRGGMYQRRRRSRIYIPQFGFQAAWARGSNVLLGFQQP